MKPQHVLANSIVLRIFGYEDVNVKSVIHVAMISSCITYPMVCYKV